MSSKVLGDDLIGVFNEVVALLEKNLKYLEHVNLNPTTAKAYKKTITYLKRRTEKEIASILGIQKQKTRRTRNQSDPEMSDEEIRSLTGEQIKALSSTTVSRKFLEQLASVRFGVSTGALSVLRNRKALVDKLNTLVNHEGTHDAISRAIGSGENSPEPGTQRIRKTSG